MSATIDQLFKRGFRAIVVMTGHGPLDLNHLLKRACAEAEERHPGLAAYGLCWLELNAARLTGPDEGDPSTVDHAARIETSWMLELAPELVLLERLVGRSAKRPTSGSTGATRASPPRPSSGGSRSTTAPTLLAERARGLLAGERPDTFADLRKFVEHGWHERPVLSGAPGRRPVSCCTTRELPSRYLSSLERRARRRAASTRSSSCW